jgi:hypothetical protein
MMRTFGTESSLPTLTGLQVQTQIMFWNVRSALHPVFDHRPAASPWLVLEKLFDFSPADEDHVVVFQGLAKLRAGDGL